MGPNAVRCGHANECLRRKISEERRNTPMKAIWLYRTAAVLLILFAAGHTFGFLNFKAPTAEGVAVFDAMNHVRFTARGATYSYGDFYRGFGLYISVYLLFSAFLAWHLGSQAQTLPQAI